MRRKQIEKEKERPKYIESIMAAAERRKAEQMYIKDKNEIKKREKEEGEGETQKFVTKTYESHLSENKRRIDLEKRREIYDKEHSVANKEFGMMGFYSTLLTKNRLFSESENKDADVKNLNKDELPKIVPKEVVNDKVENAIKIEPVIQQKNIDNEEANKEDTTPEANPIDKAEEYKKRYLERKRNRDNI